MFVVLLIGFIAIAFIYETFFNGRWNKDQAGRNKER